VPGDHFGLDHHLRISFGPPPDYLTAGLERIHELIVDLPRWIEPFAGHPE
jgi:hypothetical protein